ncbi:MAG: carboxymuconolactone decarboxylase family protein [Nitrospiraceae bacterium]|nr:carboxymuconolactone decarboxylase family protein [Nitrospiraceae bacterium]
MREKKDIVKQADALMKDDALADALVEELENERGGLGFLLGTLREKRPRTFSPYILKGRSVYNPSALDRKTAELAAVAAASALRCGHCLDAHIERAEQEGASAEEIMDVLLISAAVCESSTLSVSLRRFRQREDRKKRRKGD